MLKKEDIFYGIELTSFLSSITTVVGGGSTIGIELVKEAKKIENIQNATSYIESLSDEELNRLINTDNVLNNYKITESPKTFVKKI